MNRSLKISGLVSLILLLIKCATITTPMGGPKDEEPPHLISSSPKNNERNFKRNTVELTFNEDLKLKDPKEEIIITPQPGKEVSIQVKSKKLTIEPKEGWKENTTYSISFREGVQDITEGNPAEDLRLAFSTGSIIDSLSISGTVKYALAEKIPEKITVAIYTSDTFDIFKHAPLYFTKADKNGNFKINNLKSDTFLIYAFDDKNKNLKVEGQNESFGFIAEPIVLTKNKTKVTIPLVKLDNRKLKINKPRSTGDISFIKFNKSIANYQIRPNDSSQHLHLLHSFSDDQSEIKLLLQNIESDSIQINISAIDSLDQKIDTLLYLKKGKNQKVEEKLKADVTSPYIEFETGNVQFSITSNKLIKSLNPDSITLQLDSLVKINFKTTDYTWDTIHKKIELKTTIDKKLIDLNKKIELILGKNFLETYENDSIKGSAKTIAVSTIEETGTLTININTDTQDNLIIQLLQSDKVVQTAYNQKKYTFKYLEPGSYKVRVVIDKNKNGKWDPGNIYRKEEPEKTIYYIDREKKYETPMRANWESEITISL